MTDRASTSHVRRSARAGASVPQWLRVAKVLLWVGSLVPLVLLLYDGLSDGLGAEPVEEITHRTGGTALSLLVISLMVTPLRRLSGWNALVQLRRPLGLFAFFYACLHVLTYFVLDQWLALEYIVEDVVERPYITVGFAAWLLLLPLAVTSTRGWIRRLGKRWQRLHRLVYPAAVLGVLHLYWLVKADIGEPLMYGVVLLVLFALRLPVVQRRLSRRGRGFVQRTAPAARDA